VSTFSKRRVTTTRHEYVVPSPAPLAEVMKAIAYAKQEMPEARRSYDDACMVEACDDEIVIWWTEKSEGQTDAGANQRTQMEELRLIGQMPPGEEKTAFAADWIRRYIDDGPDQVSGGDPQ
jgi:hypothetical protein